MVIFLVNNNNTLVVYWANDMKNQAGKFILRQTKILSYHWKDDIANVDY